MALALLAPAVVTAWVTGRGCDLSGSRLVAVSLAGTVIAGLAWAATGWLLAAAPQPALLASVAAEAALALVLLLYALEATLVLPLIARSAINLTRRTGWRMLAGQAARRLCAKTSGGQAAEAGAIAVDEGG